MKLVISLICLFLGASSFAEPVQIFHEEQASRAKWVKKILTETYKIPEELIQLKVAKACDELKEKGKLDFCINSNGDLLIVSADSGFVSESLKIFRAP